MATQTLRTLAIYRQEGKEGLTWYNEPGEEASQTYKTGAPLVYDASSKELEIWAGGTDTTAIVGVAAKDATGTTGADVPVYEANDYNIFEGSLINGTAAYTLLGTELGGEYSLIASGNNWYIDIADSTTKKVEVVGLIDAVNDINPRVKFRFLADLQANVQEA